MSEDWTLTFSKGSEYTEHRDGVPWNEAPRPWRWHRCRPQTRGVVEGRDGERLLVERCRCGGIRMALHQGYGWWPSLPGFWINRNERRKKINGTPTG